MFKVYWRDSNFCIVGEKSFETEQEADNFCVENNGQNGGYVYFQSPQEDDIKYRSNPKPTRPETAAIIRQFITVVTIVTIVTALTR